MSYEPHGRTLPIALVIAAVLWLFGAAGGAGCSGPTGGGATDVLRSDGPAPRDAGDAAPPRDAPTEDAPGSGDARGPDAGLGDTGCADGARDAGGDGAADLEPLPDGCTCRSGPCCDGCGFRPAGWVCQAEAEERGCPWGVRCGSDAARRRASRSCSGTSAACDGPFGALGEWELAADCGDGEGCVDGACAASTTCPGTSCPAAACPAIEGAAGTCNPATGRCEYALSAHTDTWVLLSPGTFEMGQAPDEIPLHPTHNWVRHPVTLTRPFLVRATELTQREWNAVMDRNPNPAPRPGDRYPQGYVTWWEALAYVNALSRAEGLPECYDLHDCVGTPGEHPRTGSRYWENWFHCEPVGLDKLDCPGYRLPTEAEWEYLCRAGSPTELPTGATWAGDHCDAPEVAELAWFSGNSGWPPYAGAPECCSCLECPNPVLGTPCGPREVGQKLPNAWGLYDVLGNEYEWVNDWGYDPYPQAPVVDPMGGEPGHLNPYHPDEEWHMIRGGGFHATASFSRCSVRENSSAATGSGGLRPARTVR